MLIIKVNMFLVVWLLLSHFHVTLSAQGGLLIPVPRSYTTTSARFGLRNTHPCGNNAFATQYPSTSKTYANFLHQHLIDPSKQVLTEGSILNVSWIPVFFSRNDSYYRFSLCMDTSTYTYTKCIELSEIGTNKTSFNLYFDSYDVNQYNSGYNYHWASITDKFSIYEEQIKFHKLRVPNHLFHSLGITDTDNTNISATLVFEWVVSDYEVIDNCADIIILAGDDTNEDHTKTVAFDDLTLSTIDSLPTEVDSVCKKNPNGSTYDALSVAAIGEKCGKNQATCAPGQCCTKYGVCGPYMSNVYQYYYSDILMESIPIYLSLPNSGSIDGMSAQLSVCETDISIDNRYIPDSKLSTHGYNPNDFLDLCWMCSLSNPKDCTYTNYFDANNSNIITQVYNFYDAATESSNNNGNGSNGINLNDSNLGDLIVIVIFVAIFGCILTFLYRAYKFSQTNHRTTKMRLLDLEPDDMGKRDISNSAIDATGGSMHAHDDMTYGQHGYSDDSDNGDDNDKDPLDINDDLDNDRVGGILGRASLDGKIATEKPLPTGWEEYRTDAGERYYHNPVTNTTTWERPE